MATEGRGENTVCTLETNDHFEHIIAVFEKFSDWAESPAADSQLTSCWNTAAEVSDMDQPAKD